MKRFNLHRNEAVVIDYTITFEVARIRRGVVVCKTECLDGTLQAVPLRPGMGVDISPHYTVIVDRVGWFSATFLINDAMGQISIQPLAYTSFGGGGTLPHIAPDLMGIPRVGGDDLWS